MLDDIATFAGDALRPVHAVVMDNRCDDEGKPVTPSKVRLDAATYLLDQFIGKANTSIDLSGSNPLVGRRKRTRTLPKPTSAAGI